jgi:hypothetical protein
VQTPSACNFVGATSVGGLGDYWLVHYERIAYMRARQAGLTVRFYWGQVERRFRVCEALSL